jgi:3-hydroxyisobutyrate dehydrogenase
MDMAYLQLKGRLMIEGSFEPSFKAALAAKDAGLVLEAAERSDLELPLVEAVSAAFAQAIELGHGDEDMAAVIEARGQGARA